MGDTTDESQEPKSEGVEVTEKIEFDETLWANHLKTIMDTGSLDTLTKLKIRERLAEELSVTADDLKPYRNDINRMLDDIISAKCPKPEPKSSKARPPDSSSKPAKKRKLDDAGEAVGQSSSVEEGSESGSSVRPSSAEESDYSDSEEDVKRKKSKKPKASPKKGNRKAQSLAMTAAQFLEKAEEIDVKMGPHCAFQAKPKQFSTGSCGWGYFGKLWLKAGEKDLNCQMSFNCTVVGSKEWSDGKKD